VVEDERSAREAVRRFLEYRGHDVEIAATAEDAMDCAIRFPPDILVSDWKLSGDADGVDAAAKLQGRYDLGVILVTAHRIEDLKRKARNAGVFVSVFRRKPLSLARLADAIEGMARTRRAAAAL
jgi:two-component system response regulator MprA